MPVDVRWTADEVVVKMLLGWVVHGSARVSCAGRSLSVEVERCARDHGAGRASGELKVVMLRCTIQLPYDVSADLARAHYRHGVLTIRLPLSAAPSAPGAD